MRLCILCLYQMLPSDDSYMHHLSNWVCAAVGLEMICRCCHAGCQKMLPGFMELRLWMPLSTSMEERLYTET